MDAHKNNVVYVSRTVVLVTALIATITTSFTLGRCYIYERRQWKGHSALQAGAAFTIDERRRLVESNE